MVMVYERIEMLTHGHLRMACRSVHGRRTCPSRRRRCRGSACASSASERPSAACDDYCIMRMVHAHLRHAAEVPVELASVNFTVRARNVQDLQAAAVQTPRDDS